MKMLMESEVNTSVETAAKAKSNCHCEALCAEAISPPKKNEIASLRNARNDRFMVSLGSILLLFSIVLSGCAKSYPYLFLTDNCRCERYTYHDPQQQFDIVFEAWYEVDDRVVTTVDIEFHNRSRDTLSLRQAYVKGSSRNVKYQYNDKWVPMPFETIPPGRSFSMSFRGGDTEMVSDPWQKIAGERTVLEIKSLILGKTFLEPIRVELVPTNPKLMM